VRRLVDALPIAALALLLAVAAAACGGGGGSKPSGGGDQGTPLLGQKGDEEPAGPALGFPVFATKNTTRVAGGDPVADAAAVAQAVFPSRSRDTRPRAVVLVDQDDWRAGIAAAQLMGRPLRAPVLFTEGGNLPKATADALEKLAPGGAKEARGAQVIRVGDVARPDGLKSTDVAGADPASVARAIDRVQRSAAGKPSAAVLVASADRPDFAMPAAGWAARSGDPVLWTGRDEVPPATRRAIEAHKRPDIYVLGPPEVISEAVVKQLGRLGAVRRVQGPDPVANAIAFARFTDGRFGWNVVDPGHGLVFASTRRTQDAAAGAPLSGSGTYGPLLLISEAQALPQPLQDYLLDIQPGYDKDPVRGVYNHGWLMGDETAISADVQARLDTLLEIQPVENGGD
jgi:putative cell wall-binding protein